MALLDRWRKRDADPAPLGDSRPFLRVLRADGQRVDLTARDAGTRLSLVRQDWQNDAWTYRDMIGELRYAQRLLARSVSQVRFYAAEIRSYPEDPVELSGTDHDLDSQLAADAVANLERLPLDDGPDGFVATFTENIETAGEVWIHGEPDDGDGERWTVRSVSEITGAGDQILLAELPTQSTLGQRRIDPDREELLRCWTRHPRWGQLADSPLRAMLDVLEEVVLTGREMRAAARSRIASNGVLLVPTALTLLRTREGDEALDEQGLFDGDFMADFTEALTAPIRNEGDAGAVVPLVLRGDAEALKEVRHLSLTREDAAKLMERLQGAVIRMLQGLDIQPEQVQGLGATNHWNAWSIEAGSVRHQVLPMCGIVAGCLTKAFLRPALTALGHPADQVKRVAVWYDASGLVESPDRSQDARDAWDRDTISDTALREALGFTDDHAPDARERLLRALIGGRLNPQSVPLVAALAGIEIQDLPNPQVQQAVTIPQNGRALPSGDTAHPASPDQVVPEKPAPTPPDETLPITAAAVPGWRVDLETVRALTDIDAALMERVLIAADATIARAVERAGGRVKNTIRNKVKKDPALAAALEGADALLVPFTVGQDRLAEFVSLPELLAGAYDRLRGQFRQWLSQAAQSAADTTLKVLGLSPGTPQGRATRDQIITRLEVHQPAAWDALSDALDTAARRAMFRADPLSADPPEQGEHSTTLITPSEVSHALIVAGGGTQSGEGRFSTGPVVRDVVTEHGGVVLGWEWQYRPEVPRGAHFPPHMALDGVRFSTWTDPKLDTSAATDWLGAFFHPQDHRGCRCDATPVIAVPADDPDDIIGQRIREVAASTQGRLAAQIAAEDTAAGRIGTSLQNEVEIRERVLVGIEQLRSHYINGSR